MKVVLAAVIAIASVGCASKYVPPEGTSPVVQRDINANYDAVWTAVVDKFASDLIAIKTIEKDSGIIAAEKPIAVPAEWTQYVDLGTLNGVRIGTTDDARFLGATMTYNVFVRRMDPSRQQVTVNAGWRGGVLYYDGWKGIWQQVGNVAAVSTGAFERGFLDDIQRRVKP